MAYDVGPGMSTSPATRVAPEHERTGQGAGRIGLIDVARGVAIVAVVVYHLVWDLGDLGLIDSTPAQGETGKNVAHGIAGSFIFLVGVSLVLAHGDRFRPRKFLRRLAELVGYALLVSVVTLLIFPSQWVSFGILQCLAVASVLALPFLRASRLLAVGAAVLAFALPGLVTIPGDSRWLSWTGLTEDVQPTIDHAPLLPLFGLTLLGIVLMRTLRERGDDVRLARVRTDRGPLGWLAFVGRHTLVIYLLHQPILLGLLNAWVWLRR